MRGCLWLLSAAELAGVHSLHCAFQEPFLAELLVLAGIDSRWLDSCGQKKRSLRLVPWPLAMGPFHSCGPFLWAPVWYVTVCGMLFVCTALQTSPC